MKDMIALANQIIDGYRLKREEDLSFLIDCDLVQMCEGADKIRAHFMGNKVDLCTIINGKSGRCSEDCKYCAQSAHHHTSCDVYEFMDKEDILKEALANETEGVDRFAIVTSGRGMNDSDFEKALDAYETMNEKCTLSLCASHGFLTDEQFGRLYDAGVRSYHENIETSERHFSDICTTHTYAEKIDCIRLAKKHGFYVCSGGIIGMGETWEDRIDMAVSLSEIQVDSIPVNALMPIPGTPLEGLDTLSEEDILRTLAIFRYLNPETSIRLAAGRGLMENNGEKAFKSGVDATITGNMLTTSGSSIASDRKMLKEIGRETISAPER